MTKQDITRDPLTGLLNRREFERHLRVALAAAYARSTRHALCYLDLDQFRSVNHVCGHDAGDQVLVEVAARMRDTVGDLGVVARVGGDEFMILLKDCPIEKAQETAERIVRELADYRFNWNDQVFSVGVSIGLVELSDESGSLADEIRAADSACCSAKEQGDHVRVSSAREEAEARRRDEMPRLQRIQAVLNCGPPELEIRPIGLPGARTSSVPGFEVVLRLKDETGAAVAWREFLSAAESLHLLARVDRWILKTGLDALSRDAVDLPAGQRLVIRLSGHSLAEDDFLQFAVDCFDRTGVSPDRICFEITEDSVVSNADCARLFIAVMHGMGCWFGLGGIGREPAFFDCLSSRQFAYLKFDADLIRNLASDREQRAKVTPMIERARMLGFQVIASKVDDPGAIDDVIAVEIDWVMEGEKVLHLMVHADRSIHRQGDGTQSGVSCYLHTGRSEVPLLPKVLEALDPGLLTTGGVMVLDPAAGKPCKLIIQFAYRDGGGNAFEFWYGSASAEPHPAIMAFVRNAIEQTDAWYQSLRPDSQGGD